MALQQNLEIFYRPEFQKATLILCLICVSAVIGLLAYLTRRTGRAHFRLWTMAFIVYAVYLGVSIALDALSAGPLKQIEEALIFERKQDRGGLFLRESVTRDQGESHKLQL